MYLIYLCGWWLGLAYWSILHLARVDLGLPCCLDFLGQPHGT